ncbi:hypothetical protein F2Q70_00003350 [Brassica cretica]|uniref:Uncharacterized protein n=1 Tax=Brassica cretica TaxID=69181 RepID=A0A8S9IYL5_BRACR|nr:hypothetical protein F2Q70_00003350 [Brassica cretica]
MEEPPSEEVSAVEEGKTWMTPLILYLEADILPEDRSEARKIKKQAARYCISQEKLYQRSFSGPYLSWKEKHLERQARPRGTQAKTPAPRNIRDKLQGQGAGESPHSTSRRPGYLAHCSELPGKKDTGGRRSNSEGNPPYRVQRGSQTNRQGDYPPHHSEGKDQGLIEITEQTSGLSHRGTEGRGNRRGAIYRRRSDPTSQDCWKEKHLERQARPRGTQAKTPAPRNIRDKLQGQGAGESPHSTSRRPGYLAHCSELPGKKDTGGRRSNSEDHSEGKDQGLIEITEQTSGLSHRRTGGRGNRRGAVGVGRSREVLIADGGSGEHLADKVRVELVRSVTKGSDPHRLQRLEHILVDTELNESLGVAKTGRVIKIDWLVLLFSRPWVRGGGWLLCSLWERVVRLPCFIGRLLGAWRHLQRKQKFFISSILGCIEEKESN